MFLREYVCGERWHNIEDVLNPILRVFKNLLQLLCDIHFLTNLINLSPMAIQNTAYWAYINNDAATAN